MIAAWLVPAAQAGPFLQVGTGQRVLDVPTTELLFGGGSRLGWDLGPVAPFVGGTLLTGGLDLDTTTPDAEKVSGTTWSLAGGVRVDLASDPERPLPYLAAGATVGNAASAFEYPEGDETVVVGLKAGPGAFGGFGVDAPLAPRLALGLEVGGAYATGKVFLRVEDGPDVERAEYPGSAAFGYADLHLSFALGGGAP